MLDLKLRKEWNKPKPVYDKLESTNALYPCYTRNWASCVNASGSKKSYSRGHNRSLKLLDDYHNKFLNNRRMC